MSKELSFESVNAHVEKYFTPELADAKPGATSICSVYATVKPILEFAVKFIPAKWASALKTLMGALDAMCPSQKG